MEEIKSGALSSETLSKQTDNFLKENAKKGFSLVELIIVIAIMAILVGIVGTQVIPYLNRSREAKDLQVLDAFNTAATTAYSYNAEEFDEDDVTITIDGSGVTSDSTSLTEDFEELSGYEQLSKDMWSSNAGKALESVTITISPSAGTITTKAAGFDDVVSQIGGSNLTHRS